MAKCRGCGKRLYSVFKELGMCRQCSELEKPPKLPKPARRKSGPVLTVENARTWFERFGESNISATGREYYEFLLLEVEKSCAGMV